MLSYFRSSYIKEYVVLDLSNTHLMVCLGPARELVLHTGTENFSYG